MPHERLSFDDGTLYTGGDHRQRYHFASEMFGDGELILDIACGCGYGAAILAERGGSSVVAVDKDASALSEGARLFPSASINFRKIDVETPFPSDLGEKKFDFAVSFETLEHLANPEKFLQRLRQVVKKDGMVMISCPNGENLSEEKRKNPTNPYHFHEYTRKEFAEMVENTFSDATFYGQWETYDCRKRLAYEKKVYETLAEAYWSPYMRFWRILRKLCGKTLAGPPQYPGIGSNYTWDFDIQLLDSISYPWHPTTFIAVANV
jgi:cyclopropane fatty-acyl-phospholipid synthase-like methyltransferase